MSLHHLFWGFYLILFLSWQGVFVSNASEVAPSADPDEVAFLTSLRSLTPITASESGQYLPFEVVDTNYLRDRSIPFEKIRFVAEGEIVQVNPALSPYKGYFLSPLCPCNGIIVVNKKTNLFFVAHQHLEDGLSYALTTEAIKFLTLERLSDVEITVYSSLMLYETFKKNGYDKKFSGKSQPQHIVDTKQQLLELICSINSFSIGEAPEESFRAYGGDPLGCFYGGKKADDVHSDEDLSAMMVSRGMLISERADAFYHFNSFFEDLMSRSDPVKSKMKALSLVMSCIQRISKERWSSFMPSGKGAHAESDFYNGDSSPLTLQDANRVVFGGMSVKPNDRCLCRSGKKYKVCCGGVSSKGGK